MPVTGESEPKASGTPWDANSASGLSRTARSRPRRCAYIPSVAAPQRVEVRLHAGDDAPRAEPGGLLGGHHFDVLEPVSAARDRLSPELVDHPLQSIDNRADRRIPDDVEAGRDARFGAGAQMRCDGPRLEVGVAAAVRRISVGLLQPGRSRPQGAVDEQIACQPAGTRRLGQGLGPAAVSDGFAPVPDDLDAVVGVVQFLPVVQAADVGASAFVDGDDPAGRREVEGGDPGAGTLVGSQPVTGGRTHQVVGVGGQRALRVEARRGRQARCEPPQCRGGCCRMHVDPGQVGRPITDHAVQVVGARWRRVRPARLVPAVPPDRPGGMCAARTRR